MQGREWIAPPVCMRIIEGVLANRELLNLADWYVVPIANPEGYGESWENVIDLLKIIEIFACMSCDNTL